jgi:signal transduction histidine kinase
LEGRSSSFDVRHANRIYRAHVLPVRSGDEVVGMAVMQDVTEERRAGALAASEAALRVANTQLSELSRAKSELLSVVSHEVRTPLASIRGFSEMLRDDLLGPEKVSGYASIINAEARRLGRLVDDLLDLEQLESGRAGLHPETVELHAIVTEAVERAKPIADGHSFLIAVEPSVPVLRADPDKVMQVLANLLDNAIKYSPNGGTVTIGGSAEGRYVCLWVRDEGLGLPPDALEAVFDRYARVDSAGHRAIKGSGLGLPIVRQIAELHGGRSWAESVPGHGATFYVTLAIDGPPTQESVRRSDRPAPR